MFCIFPIQFIIGVLSSLRKSNGHSTRGDTLKCVQPISLWSLTRGTSSHHVLDSHQLTNGVTTSLEPATTSGSGSRLRAIQKVFEQQLGQNLSGSAGLQMSTTRFLSDL